MTAPTLKPKILSTTTRIEGPAGARLVVETPEGWRVQWPTGAGVGDPVLESYAEAVEWAKDIVNAKGKALHAPPPALPPRQPSPNERPDALAKAAPRPLTAADLAKGVVGRYVYSHEDAPRVPRSRSHR